MPNQISVFLKPHFWAENDSLGSPEAIYEPGGQGERWEALGIERINLLQCRQQHHHQQQLKQQQQQPNG